MRCVTWKHFVNTCLPFSFRKEASLFRLSDPRTLPFVVLITGGTSVPQGHMCMLIRPTDTQTLTDIVLIRVPNCKQQKTTEADVRRKEIMERIKV